MWVLRLLLWVSWLLQTTSRKLEVEMEEGGSNSSRHCSSPSGSIDGRIVVEEDGGTLEDFTTLSWSIGLGETLCYK